MFIATIMSSVVRSVFSPSITPNVKAYIALAQSVSCGRLSDAKNLADSAYQTADDPDLRKLANWFSREDSFVLNTGVQTREEADSFTGLTKAFMTGVKNPLLSIESAAMAAESIFGGWKTLGDRADSNYLPILRRYRLAQTIGSVTFWLVLACAAYGYYRYRHQISVWLRPRIQRFPFVNASPAQAPSHV